MTRTNLLRAAAAMIVIGVAAQAQNAVSLDGKNISVKPAAGAPGTVATLALHTDADIVFKGATVTKGDYSLYVIASGPAYQLVINKAPGGKATHDAKLDVGKVAMAVTKPPSPAAANHAAVVKVAAMAAKIEVGVQGSLATAQFKLDRVAGDSEW